MTKQEALDLLLGKIKESKSFHLALALIHWDAMVTGVPTKSYAARGAAEGWLSMETFKRMMAPETLEAVETLEAHDSELTETERAMTRVAGRSYRKAKAVPPEEFGAFRALVSESNQVWETAREKRDYEMMLPYYEKIFDYQRKLCDWYGYENHPYDALLDDYEIGANVETLDRFFSALRNEIVPLLKEITGVTAQAQEITGTFDIDKQRELMPWLADFTGFDRTRGKVGEVEHPFCLTVNRHDVRITTKYHEDNLLSAIYSIIHECGHGIYEQNMSEEIEPYALADCASMGMHESQSRLYENMIGRSRAYTERLLPKLQEKFDFFKNWDADTLYRAVNIARPSLIRIEADELTYSLHIMVRYELEKGLIEGKIKAKELPTLWADKYEELLGIRPKHLAEGVLQDVHWGAGLFGYFPSYAIGTAYGAQMMHTIRTTAGIDVDAAIRKEDLSPITSWLRDNIHTKGSLYLPEELLKRATGETFNPQYYVNYLKEKFTGIYLKSTVNN